MDNKIGTTSNESKSFHVPKRPNNTIVRHEIRSLTVFFFAQGEVAARSVAGSVRSTRRWASLRQHVAANEGGKPRVELLLDPPGSKSSTPSSPQPHTPNTPRTPHTPSRKSNWEVIEHFTGAPRPSIVTVSQSWHTVLLRDGPSLFFLLTPFLVLHSHRSNLELSCVIG